jgi:hypothetical protein
VIELLPYPVLSDSTQALIRASYGALMALTLIAALPHARRYFMSEQWGGYAQSGTLSNALQNPVVLPLIVASWLAAAAGLVWNAAVVPAAFTNLLWCYYFFNRLRWTSVSRGMGAPGFMALWLAAVVFLLEVTARHAPDLQPLVALTAQIDFAAIMLSAGIYKAAAGYRHRQGMELGMVNPEWGYWPSFWKRWPPSHPIFRFFNESAWLTEMGCGVLMLIPATRVFGAAGIFASFVFIATQIRLGWLCEMVMVCCLLFIDGGSMAGAWIASAVNAIGVTPAVAGAPLQEWMRTAIWAGCWTYLALLPLVRIALFYNQLKHRAWPAPVQRMLDAYANTFGIILWRVFTADVVNFFVRVWEEPASGARQLRSDFRRSGWSRFAQVAESIALTSVFTTLRYYPSDRGIFNERLLRYARTIPHASSSRLVFEWNDIVDRGDRFEYEPAMEFAVSLPDGNITEKALRDGAAPWRPATVSPIHEGARPGSYAPKVNHVRH